MTIENNNTQINFVNPEKDGGVMQRTLQQVYDLTLEIQSATDAIKSTLDNGFEQYKDYIDSEAKKGDYNKFIKKLVAEILEGKVTSEVETLENVLAQVDIAKKGLK